MASNRSLFCDICPAFYAISTQKEIYKRHLKNFLSKERFAKIKRAEHLPNTVSSRSTNLIKRAKGIDLRLQENKAINIQLAGEKINGLVIRPGEVFSFYKIVGKATKKRGYKEGRIIKDKKLIAGMGGGLCNLANTIHWLILHSPLEITEIHHHSDALAPDEGKRIPFSAGTSVHYNYIDFRFKNTTDQNVQLLVHCEDNRLYAELRSEKEYPWCYELVEEDHHFRKEGKKYYRISKIYKQVSDRATGTILEKRLIWDNHSEVMYDYDLIPKELIRA